MRVGWTPAETDTHQEHVIAHVLGATVLGHFVADEAAHFVLDIGFVWTILLDGAMGLVPHSMALAELNVAAEERAAITADVRALYEATAGAARTRASAASAPVSYKACTSSDSAARSSSRTFNSDSAGRSSTSVILPSNRIDQMKPMSKTKCAASSATK